MPNSQWPTYSDLMAAYKSCRLHKSDSPSQTKFETHLAKNIADLHRAIHAGTYEPLPSRCFVVTHPRPREIFAADFRDRVVHHLIVSRLEPTLNRKFIHASFACRTGRGTHGAIRFLQKKVRILSQGGYKPVWSLQLDIEKFFVSIDRMILCSLIQEHQKNPMCLRLISAIYGYDARRKAKKSSPAWMYSLIPSGKSWFEQGPNQGIPIGNLTSQFGANVYLTGLDHFIQRELKPKSYLRYMDDLLLLDHDSDKLMTMVEPIDQWLQLNRKQRLNPSKTKLTLLSDGIHYLGYQLFQKDTHPAQPLQIFAEPSKLWKLVQSARKFEKNQILKTNRPHPLAPWLPGDQIKKDLCEINSRIGVLVHANTYRLRKNTLGKLIKNTQEYKDIPIELGGDSWSHYRLKKGYRSIKIR